MCLAVEKDDIKYSPAVYKEGDSGPAHIARMIMKLARMIKVRNNKLSLTKSGENLLANPWKLYETIFITFCKVFNWAYQEWFDNHNFGQFGFAFSLILVGKYGDKYRNAEFYSEKYFSAFPDLLNEIQDEPYISGKERAFSSYSFLTFDRFLLWFGLVSLKQDEDWRSPLYVKKTSLFEKVIKFTPPGKKS